MHTKSTQDKGWLRVFQDASQKNRPLPCTIGRSHDDVLWARGHWAFAANSGLDLNRDGRITVGEATQRVINHNTAFNRVRRDGR